MNARRLIGLVALLGLMGGWVALAGLQADDPVPKEGPAKADPAKAESPKPTAPARKPLSKQQLQGLTYLAKQQQSNGGWGSGDDFALPALPGTKPAKPPRGVPTDNK